MDTDVSERLPSFNLAVAVDSNRRQDVARQHLVAQAAPPEGAAATAPAPATRTSLIPETLEGMEQDTELQQYLQQLAKSGQQALTREERLKRQRSLDKLGVPSFYAVCKVPPHPGKEGRDDGLPASSRFATIPSSKKMDHSSQCKAYKTQWLLAPAG